MAYIGHEVRHYGVVMYSKTGNENAQRILLYGTDGNIKAFVYFYEGDGPIPAPGGSSAPRDIRLYYRSERLQDVLDVLRNEKPIWVFYNEATGIGGINTAAEEVGEEET